MRTTTHTVSAQLMTTKVPTMPTTLAPEPELKAAAQSATSSSPQLKAMISSAPQQIFISLKSAGNQPFTPNQSNLVVFYIAIALSILCAVIVAALVILYYRVFHADRVIMEIQYPPMPAHLDFDNISDKHEYI